MPRVFSSLLGALAEVRPALLELLYPARCAGCGRPGSYFCPACQAKANALPADTCLRCAAPTAGKALCPRCHRSRWALDDLLATGRFAPPLRPAIHMLKYRGARVLAEPLGMRLATAWRDSGLKADLIVPVPLHTAREADRGYNQSTLLAHAFAVALDLPIPVSTTLLARERPTPQQVAMSYAERQANVRGAFRCRESAAGLRIALLDDVCTTGATLETCAEALKAGGATRVYGLVVARATRG